MNASQSLKEGDNFFIADKKSLKKDRDRVNQKERPQKGKPEFKEGREMIDPWKIIGKIGA